MSNGATQAAHDSLNRLAFSATVHCLAGCTIGEVLGMVIGTAAGMANAPTIALSVALAFVFGYSLTMLPLLRAGVALRTALGLALVSDTVSITVMEIVDNAVMLVIPGAMGAGLWNARFWGGLAVAMLLAGVAAFPVVRWLIARGRGHAVVHGYHQQAAGKRPRFVVDPHAGGFRPGVDPTRLNQLEAEDAGGEARDDK